MSRKPRSTPSRPEMVKAVDEMLKNLEKLAPDPGIVSACPELPGIALDQVLSKVQSRDDSDYQEITRNYRSMRSEYLRALAAHPVGRALALLAVGAEGVAMLEAGRTPCAVSEVSNRPHRSLRSRREPYNCHHVIPKSLQVAGSAAAINHPANLVMAKTVRRGRDQSQNPHHCWHALLLHPQTHNAPATPIPVYVVRPLFPFYPPITQGFRSAKSSAPDCKLSALLHCPRYGRRGSWNSPRPPNIKRTASHGNFMRSPKCLEIFTGRRTRIPPPTWQPGGRWQKSRQSRPRNGFRPVPFLTEYQMIFLSRSRTLRYARNLLYPLVFGR